MPMRPYAAIAAAGALVAGTAITAVLATSTARGPERATLASSARRHATSPGPGAGIVQGTGVRAGTGSGGAYVVPQAAVTAAAAYWTPAAMSATATSAATASAQAGTKGSADAISQQAAAAQPAAGHRPKKSAAKSPPKGTPKARAFSGVPTVGTLFYTTGTGRHFCTGSVLDSATGDLVLTAAHCVYSGRYSRNVVFVPGYADGKEPWGAWPVKTIIVAKGWRSVQDPNWDLAFLQVTSPADSAGPIERVTGGLRLGYGLGYRQRLTAIGYNDTDSQPVQCASSSFAFTASQLEFYCWDFWFGTSGGPWITGYDPVTGEGTVFGVIGGYEAGGYYSWASYSAVFGRAQYGLFLLAERDAAAASAAEISAAEIRQRDASAARR
jgi:V8-like Glu-specific endopeptidase